MLLLCLATVLPLLLLLLGSVDVVAAVDGVDAIVVLLAVLVLVVVVVVASPLSPPGISFKLERCFLKGALIRLFPKVGIFLFFLFSFILYLVYFSCFF